MYGVTGKLSSDYHGGYWEFYKLSNGGFYMAQDTGRKFQVFCENGFAGELSADALGITADYAELGIDATIPSSGLCRL